MTRSNKAFVVIIVALLGLWGCAQGPAGPRGHGEKVKALEVRCTRLEDECKQVTVARDQVRKKLAEVEEQRLQALQEVEQKNVLLKEPHDELKAQIQSRTAERDAMQAEFDNFRQGLRTLLKDADAASATMPSVPGISVLGVSAPGKS